MIYILTNHRLDEHEARAPGRDLTLAEDSQKVTEQQVTLPALQPEVRPEILASQERPGRLQRQEGPVPRE